MPVLSRADILDHIRTGRLAFTPRLDGFQIQPHAVDLRLGTSFRIPKPWHITARGREAMIVDPFELNGEQHETVVLKPGQVFELLPGEVVITETLERVELNGENFMAVLFPRSSVNRRGLSVDMSGIVDVWYQGKLMIPVSNKTDQVIRLYPGERICQLIFETLSSPIDHVAAVQHGLNKAKYLETQDPSFKKDRLEEITLVQQGRLDELKERYKLP
ncbi:MAG: dCTP deaminase [Parcubacteria group bacterium]|nr:dCTP deaminase [Parcubacteria group bacterium]